MDIELIRNFMKTEKILKENLRLFLFEKEGMVLVNKIMNKIAHEMDFPQLKYPQ